jgi:hypothetical protein
LTLAMSASVSDGDAEMPPWTIRIFFCTML